MFGGSPPKTNSTKRADHLGRAGHKRSTSRVTDHVIACERDAAWLHTYRGHTVGPFKAREDAIKLAIETAQETGDKAVEVDRPKS